MRQAMVFVGIGAIVILIGILLINTSFTQPRENRNTMATSTLSLTSTAFSPNASIPSEYTCDASQKSPPLLISGAPSGAKSFALIVEDPDVPKQLKPDGIFVHWVLFNISPDVTEIPENTPMGILGANGAGKNAYAGPCPPKEYEPSEHRYFFRLYALDSELALKTGASKDEVLSAMEGHVLAQTELIGRYKKR